MNKWNFIELTPELYFDLGFFDEARSCWQLFHFNFSIVAIFSVKDFLRCGRMTNKITATNYQTK